MYDSSEEKNFQVCVELLPPPNFINSHEYARLISIQCTEAMVLMLLKLIISINSRCRQQPQTSPISENTKMGETGQK